MFSKKDAAQAANENAVHVYLTTAEFESATVVKVVETFGKMIPFKAGRAGRAITVFEIVEAGNKDIIGKRASMSRKIQGDRFHMAELNDLASAMTHLNPSNVDSKVLDSIWDVDEDEEPIVREQNKIVGLTFEVNGDFYNPRFQALDQKTRKPLKASDLK